MIVYLIENQVNGKRYVGKTRTTTTKRLQGHIANAKWGSECALHRAIRKYGPTNFTIRVLEECDSLDHLYQQEIYWIANLGTFGDGYNMTEGGEGTYGRILTPETRYKLGNGNRGKHYTEEEKAKISKALTGRLVSEETRRKISQVHKGKITSPETRAKISAAKRKGKQ